MQPGDWHDERPDRSRVAAQLVAAGYRLTPQRLAVWQALESCRPHAPMLELFDLVVEKLPTTSLRTVYEVVHLYEGLGLVRLVHLPGGARLEKEPTPHCHTYCKACGAIGDIPYGLLPPWTIAPGGFVVRSAEGVLTGLCASCAAPRS